MARIAQVEDFADTNALADWQEESSALQDIGLLLLRVLNGSLLAGHGSQKLFGMFGGFGLQGTAGWLESMGLKPGRLWATAAGASEMGGVLMALGLFHPLGEISTISSMAMATGKAHWGKPIWAVSGGPELAIINMAASLALIFTGPGRYSLDRMLDIKLPGWLIATAALGAAASVAYGLNASQAETLPNANDQGVEGTGEGGTAAS
jgi:putative oxidoreductase